MKERGILKESLYRHFKGKWYEVITVAQHTETGEDMVVYRALYGTHKIYTRPYDMFMSKVDKVKYPNASQPYRLMNLGELRDFFGSIKVEEMFNEEMANDGETKYIIIGGVGNE